MYHRGFNNGDYDLWRVSSNKLLNIEFIGDKRGAGLNTHDDDIRYMNVHRFRFGPADSKAVANTMPSIKVIMLINAFFVSSFYC